MPKIDLKELIHMGRDNSQGYFQTNVPVRQGDLLLIDYGRKKTGSRNGIKRPSVVVGNMDAMKHEDDFLVVPMFRHPSRSCRSGDIVLNPTECVGLRSEQFLQPMQVTAVNSCRVIRRIGRIKNRTVTRQIVMSIQDLVAEED